MILRASIYITLFFQQILLTEPPMNPKKNREKMIEVCVPCSFLREVLLQISGIIIWTKGSLLTRDS